MPGSGSDAAPVVALEVAGPVRLLVGTETIRLTTRQRTVLALLAAAPGRRRTVDEIATAIRGESRPASSTNALQIVVHGLRRLATTPIIETVDHGYRLADSVEVDADSVEAGFRACLTAAAAGDDVATITHFADARIRVRGEFYEDVSAEAFGVPRAALQELLLAAIEATTDSRLRVGTVGAAVSDLLAVAAVNPLRESLQERLIDALIAAGRRSEALSAYARAREAIAEELGVDPGEGLEQAFQRALRADRRGTPEQPVRTVRAVRIGLRSVPPPLVGRAAELARLDAVLAGPRRLVTLTGVGGIGKTRLAQAVVERRPGSSTFASLVAARSDDDTASTLAGELGAPAPGDADAIVRALRSTGDGFVLVLDNLEHLPGAAALVERLLLDVPGLRIVATSRRPLQLAAEALLPVGPLSVEQRDGSPSEAAALLLDRMRVLDDDGESDPADAERVARRCSGMPLALELAAARSTSIALSAIADALDDSADLLRSDRASLRDTIVATAAQLPAAVAATLDRATAFAGGCTVALLAAAGGLGELEVGDHVALLVGSGLLRRAPGRSATRRFALLEVVRDVLAAELSPDERDRIAAAHLTALLEWVRAEAVTRDFPTTHAQIESFLDERPNLRVAMRRARDPHDVVDLLGRTGTAWFRADNGAEHVARIATALESGTFSREQRHRLLIAKEQARGSASDHLSIAILDEADALGIEDPVGRAEALNLRFDVVWRRGDVETAARSRDALVALPPAELDVSMLALIDCCSAALLVHEGRIDEATALLAQTLTTCTAAGRNLSQLILGVTLSDLQLRAGRYAEAAEAATTVITFASPTERYFRSLAFTSRTSALRFLGRTEDARESAVAALRELGSAPDDAVAPIALTVVACAFAGDARMPVALAAGAGDASRHERGIPLERAEQALVDRFLPGIEEDPGYVGGRALVAAVGPTAAITQVRDRFFAAVG